MSLSFLATTTPSTTTTNQNFRRSSSKAPPSISPTLIRKRFSYTSCKQQQHGNVANDEGSNIDRRNVLVGLGGLYGATATFGNMAVGAPVQPPDLKSCHTANDTSLVNPVECCPPYGTTTTPFPEIMDFKLPDSSEPLRTRPPAQQLSKEYIAKFKEAIRLMKNLDKDDPWNFFQQAQIHCAYCNGAYNQVGTNPPVLLQVHGSWLFLPWHRYYIYFWEKILGKLIKDESFAIPYWNWDAPKGMRMPSIYLDPLAPENSLYNCNRNPQHYTALMDYQYKSGDPNPTPEQEPGIILANQKQLYNMFTEDKNFPDRFMGKPIQAGESINGPGSLENLHGIPHIWTGQLERPRWDMGNFHTAARDSIFYGHHGQVDRLWYLYSNSRGHKVEFNDPNWLDATFVFYDENRNVVKCKVSDCLDTSKLRYTYQPEEQGYLNVRRTYFLKKRAKPKKAGDDELFAIAEFGTEPRVLDTTIRALVKRPKVSRSKDEKEEAAEVLMIDDFKLDHTDNVRFDVYIAKPIEGLATADLGEFAGTFVHIPHSHGAASDMKHVLHLGITNMIDDIEADSSENLVVSLVPRQGNVTVSGVKIELVKVPED